MKLLPKIKYTGLVTNEHHRHTAPMSKEETELFLKLSLGEMNGHKRGEPEENLAAELLADPTPRIITSRLERVGVPWREVVTFPALMYLSCMEVLENPAQCVLWAYTLLYMRAAEGETINMELLSQWFPAGFPVKGYYREMWDKQKGHVLQVKNCDNFLDRREWWEELVTIIGYKIPDDTKPTRPYTPLPDTGDIIEVDGDADLPTPA